MMTAIRHLAVSRDGSLLAGAEFKEVVHLYDLSSRTRLRTFNSTLDFGGSRIAVSHDGSVLAIGAYQRHGIAAYRSADGSELWRRKDLKKVQRVVFSHAGDRIYCCFDESACQKLDALNGKSGQTLRGVRDVWTSGFGPECLLECAENYVLRNEVSDVSVIPKASFAALNAAFSPISVCLSEAGGPVRAFSIETGMLLWRHDPPEGTHFLRLAYQKSNDQFVGVSWPFKNGVNCSLCRFDRDTGDSYPVVDFPSARKCVFWRNGSRLITASGAVIDVDSGRIDAILDFPPKRSKDCEIE